MIIADIRGQREGLPVAAEKNHEVENAAMIDVGVGRRGAGTMRVTGPFSRICGRLVQDIHMHLPLQVDAHGSIDADHLIGADTCGRWNVASRIGNPNVLRIIANDVLSSLDGSSYQPLQNAL